MTSPILFGALSASLGLGFTDPPQTSGAIPSTADTIRLQVVEYPGTDAATVKLAKTVATELLQSGGIQAQWQHDDGVEPDVGRQCIRVVVQLLPFRKASQPDLSGEVAQDGITRAATVLVYVQRIAELVRAFHVSPIGRSDPRLATIEPGHLCGLAIAHEVGHILGLPHASAGVMRAQPGRDDVLKLRESRLSFPRPDVARMRQTLLALANQAQDGSAHLPLHDERNLDPTRR